MLYLSSISKSPHNSFESNPQDEPRFLKMGIILRVDFKNRRKKICVLNYLNG
jgi:hypothetical protein